MKVEIAPQVFPRRGTEVEVGNVYTNNRQPAFRDFRIVVGVVGVVHGRQPWNNIVCIHVDYKGDISGASRQPYNYVKDHWDLVGKVVEMPTLKVEWLRDSK